jgi:hypothetical protein
MEKVAMELMTLGAVLVHDHPEGAKIIARALDYIDEQHKRIEAYKKAEQAAAKKARKK